MKPTSSIIGSLNSAPLAVRVRPKRLDEIFGQEHLLDIGKPIRRLLEHRDVCSMILWGPPGSGKTTLARILVENAHANMIEMSAVLAGVRDVRKAIDDAKHKPDVRTVVFVDEVHRFNKAQQDAFLPHVEDGTITFIGATTENPSFEVISPLLSRTRVFVLKRLSDAALAKVISRALEDEYDGITLSDDCLNTVCQFADGDARRALNLLELAEQFATDKQIELEHIQQASGSMYRQFDKGGDEFYDQISVLHKTLRGSDPDAAIYWFARMIDGGCDPLYIARRVLRFATEDIGTADPRALTIARDAWDTYARLGSPEGELALACAVVYLACAPKSNAVYRATKSASEYVQSHPSWPVPLRFRNAPTPLMKSLDFGKSYKYAHNEPDAFVSDERYFPDEMEDESFYQPSERGLESRIAERLQQLKEITRNRRTKE